jgi:uncharacterized protein YlxW (UPF0749 family)
MNSNRPKGGITEKLCNDIANIKGDLTQLRHYVIQQNVPGVWEILSSLEQNMVAFEQHNYLWSHLVLENVDNKEIQDSKEYIHEEVSNLKHEIESNKTLVTSFLSAITKTLKASGMRLASKTNVYGRRGRMNMKQSSLLVQQVG